MCHTMCIPPLVLRPVLLVALAIVTSCHVDAAARSEHGALLAHVHASERSWEQHDETRYDACADTSKANHRISELHRSRKRRQASESNFRSTDYGSAVYFRGKGDSLLLRPDANVEIPQNEFSVEFWMRPEGGQHQRVAVVGVFDKCSPTLRERGWSVGLHSQQERQSRLYFSLHGDRSTTPSVVSSVTAYEVGRWVHVTAVFTGTRMLLYVDGAMVGTGYGQFGPLFNQHSLACKELLIGGDYISEQLYRGTIDELRLYGYVRSHQDARHAASGSLSADEATGPVLQESFSALGLWDTPLNLDPVRLSSSINHARHDFHLAPSPCGVTVCDDPDVIRSYGDTTGLRSQKTIRYQVVNVYSTNGDRPTVTQEQLDTQHAALNTAFRPYNISWERSVVEVRNSSLRERTILLYCEPGKVGNGVCNPECQHERTGQDGGDCADDDDDGDGGDRTPACEIDRIGDGHCDPECNRKSSDWDGEDCCDPSVTDIALTCFDPNSPNRAFLSIEEYKRQLGFTSDEQLNIFFAEWTIDSLIGLATFPWEKEVFSVLGGTVVRPDSFGHVGKTDNLVHEIGHNLGLWHVHHGVTELECGDPCREVEPSLELGDLCQDTAPTPINQKCRDPLQEELDLETCGWTEFTDTPFNNYMSYAGDNCTNEFSMDQAARMHCYLDLMYQPWLTTPSPPPVPVPPRVVGSSTTSATLVWATPLSRWSAEDEGSCSDCQEDFSLAQYGHTAWTPNQSPDKLFRAPHQATGPPDATRCGFSGHAWLPEMESCVDGPCYLEVGFEHAVIPTRLSIWVTWNADDAIEDVELLYTDGSVESLGSLPAQCDQPVTMHLQADLPMDKIRIHLKKPFVNIDAVEVISRPGHHQCDHCMPQRYAITRQPAFSDSDSTVMVDHPLFIDRNVEVDHEYTYHVQSVVGTQASASSPALIYTHGQHYCGDGLVDRNLGEECDDGNAHYGDGCDVSCRLEEFFRCRGQPSYCYKHTGDGVCEPFERTDTILDCGFFTPEDSYDQWAGSVSVKPGYLNHNCPPGVIIGPPTREHTCRKAELRSETEWHNCGLHNAVRPPWIQVEFAEARSCAAVLLYMSVSENTFSYSDAALIHLELIDTENIAHALGEQTIPVTCALTPMYVDVPVDHYGAQNRIKGIRVYVHSSDVGIAAVAMRTNILSDAYGPAACEEDQVYNPRTNQCITSSVFLCDPLLIKHGAVECSGVQAGGTCTVACGQGYVLPTHHNTATCVQGTWESRANLTCQPRDCGIPDVAYARVDCPHGTTYGKLCKFECRSPAERRGTDNVLSCESDGLWSLPESYCHILCPELPLVKDAELVTQGCLESGLPVGSNCRFQCHHGFHTHGLTPLDETLRYSCLASGQWEGPTCERTRCPPHDVIYMGLYSCTDVFYVDSQCTLKCPGPNRVTSVTTCGSDGQWDSDFVACKFQPGQCPVLQNTGILNLGWTSRNIGDDARVSCMFPNSDAVLRQVDKRSVRVAGPRHQSPVITNLICTGSLNWYPDPVDVTCVEQCNTAFLGDGYCDPSNNRNHCGWDSGDCCASTVLGGVVRTYPEDCGLECDCKDPDAEENLVRRELAQEVERQRKRFYSLHVDRSKLDPS